MKTKLTHIGTFELVSLPGDNIFDIPAKIDTGAYSSAIWASKISQHDSELSFVLFDRSSPYYTGEVITTHDYATALIKNSFGHTETRYKIRLSAIVAGRPIRARFTLANRSANRYPILIGRRTLRGKFLVEVPHTVKSKNYQTLLLTVYPTKAVKKFVKGLESVNPRLHITLATYKDLDFIFGNLSSRIVLHDSGIDIASFDMVHFKTRAGHLDIAATCARYLQKRNVLFVDQTAVNYAASSKLYQYVILNDNGIETPGSFFIMNNRLSNSYDLLVSKLGLPFVLKDIHGRKGNDDYYIDDKLSFDRVCHENSTKKLQFIGQTYVENEGDYRVLVFGQKSILTIHRMRSNLKTHLNNTSKGASAKLVTSKKVPKKILNMCIAAAKLLDRDIAGVDMIKDKLSGVWYCLEVNDGPQLATGVFLRDKQAAFAEYMERELNR